MGVPAEDILRFMSEQKNPKFEAHDKANFFIHYRLKFDGLKGKRKLKGIFFGNALTGDKTKKYSSLRLTIDKPIDLLVVKKVYKLLKKNRLNINFKNIVKIFKSNRELFQLNHKEVRDEGYKTSVLNEKKK